MGSAVAMNDVPVDMDLRKKSVSISISELLIKIKWRKM